MVRALFFLNQDRKIPSSITYVTFCVAAWTWLAFKLFQKEIVATFFKEPNRSMKWNFLWRQQKWFIQFDTGVW